jgi:hypothetical protein
VGHADLIADTFIKRKIRFIDGRPAPRRGLGGSGLLPGDQWRSFVVRRESVAAHANGTGKHPQTRGFQKL